MQNIHLSAYVSHLNKQKVKVAAHHQLRKSLYCVVLSGLCLFAGALAGSYLHIIYLNWQGYRIEISEESHLPYQQSALHYIYKNKELPAVSQTAYIDDNENAEGELPEDTSPMENETLEEAPADESDESQIIKLDEGSPDMPLQEWLKKAMLEQQQEEKSAK
ncbi:hypothetical protein [Rahnella aquatilis]|uniref:Uncharacterized protein n=1 Tax=Rahnella aquatilis (strain ATCC 33071 / DSM 4594 / JCM 1683 / NBRC 105701 / NCIMB 13365 / CIP 78.65) TaxID=745277 RepID=H2IRA4_RAHAC|nr:hypothetical protein [Rahnella aquatilis]AEX50304.1 hypothetical protein Rahaq2_0358 [Rahnella aquatilis CIP 78.65 = ATCC 33071]KFD01252.1 hypothetical protein GRAQ_03820 [Rahnella aquatilis CIP 78.65 = ATCC 33071]